MPEFAAKAHALLVGVGDYIHPRFGSLPATVRGAEAIAVTLRDPDRCGYRAGHVRVITGPEATAAHIGAALRALASAADGESTVLVYFGGHGGRIRRDAGWRTFLCPREADPDDLAATAIPGEVFSALLADIPARRVLIILDACHAAGSAELMAPVEGAQWMAGLPEEYYEALSLGSGRVVIASSKVEQYSYLRGKYSLFTHHLIEALDGKAAVHRDGLIHVLDVFHHVNEAVQAERPEQTPILKVRDLDLNFAIALDRGGAMPAAAPTPVVAEIAAIREQLVRDPLSGARALSEYLKTRPEWADKRNAVDLKRGELEKIQHDLDLFGDNPADRAEKARRVYFLLSTCLELERSAG